MAEIIPFGKERVRRRFGLEVFLRDGHWYARNYHGQLWLITPHGQLLPAEPLSEGSPHQAGRQQGQGR